MSLEMTEGAGAEAETPMGPEKPEEGF